MKKIAFVVGIGTCLVLANFGVLVITTFAQEDVATAIKAGNAKLMQALADEDAAAATNCYTADAQLLPPGAPMVEGHDAIKQYWTAGIGAGAGGLKLVSGEVRDWDDEAYEVGTYTISLEDGTVVDTGKYIVLWKRVDGVWKLHRDIWNSDKA